MKKTFYVVVNKTKEPFQWHHVALFRSLENANRFAKYMSKRNSGYWGIHRRKFDEYTEKDFGECKHEHFTCPGGIETLKCAYCTKTWKEINDR